MNNAPHPSSFPLEYPNAVSARIPTATASVQRDPLGWPSLRFTHGPSSTPHSIPRSWNKATLKGRFCPTWIRPEGQLTQEELLELLRPFNLLSAGSAIIAGGAVAEILGGPGARRGAYVDIYVYGLKAFNPQVLDNEFFNLPNIKPEITTVLDRLGYSRVGQQNHHRYEATDQLGDVDTCEDVIYGRGDLRVILNFNEAELGVEGAASILLKFDLPEHRACLHPDGQIQDLRHLSLTEALRHEHQQLGYASLTLYSSLNRWSTIAREGLYPVPPGIQALLHTFNGLPEDVGRQNHKFSIFVEAGTERAVAAWGWIQAFDLEAGESLSCGNYPLLLRYMDFDEYGLCILEGRHQNSVTVKSASRSEIEALEQAHLNHLSQGRERVRPSNLSGGWPQPPRGLLENEEEVDALPF